MKLNSYKILDEAIEKAIEYGYQRAFKYTNKPSSHNIKEEIHTAIMNELSEIINFEEQNIEK